MLRYPSGAALVVHEAKRVALWQQLPSAQRDFQPAVSLCERMLQQAPLGGPDLVGAQNWGASASNHFVPVLYAWLP